jgi:hypothetical protein
MVCARSLVHLDRLSIPIRRVALREQYTPPAKAGRHCRTKVAGESPELILRGFGFEWRPC